MARRWKGSLILLPSLLLSAGAALAALFALTRARGPRLAERSWQSAMQRLGLKFQRASEERRQWRGQLDGVFVFAELAAVPERGQLPMTLSAGANTAVPRSLEVYADSLMRSLGLLLEGQDVELGDADFDQLALLPALDAYACAALSHGARGQLAVLLRRGGQVRDGRVSLDALWGERDSATSLEQTLRWLCKLARLLSVPRQALHQRLLHNALHDPAPAVRLQNLQFLAAPETQTPRTELAGAARALLEDVHAQVRLLAARLLGAEGLPALASLLAASNPPELVCSVLDQLQREPAPGSALASPALDGLLEPVVGCTRSEQESVRLAATRLLGGWAHVPSEPALLARLADPSPYVQHAAVQALARFGTVAAVEPLLPLARALLDSQLRQSARAAVASIQSRLGPVEAGRVSLADTQPLAGAVALADPCATLGGELSLEEAGPGAAPPSTRGRSSL